MLQKDCSGCLHHEPFSIQPSEKYNKTKNSYNRNVAILFKKKIERKTLYQSAFIRSQDNKSTFNEVE